MAEEVVWVKKLKMEVCPNNEAKSVKIMSKTSVKACPSITYYCVLLFQTFSLG